MKKNKILTSIILIFWLTTTSGVLTSRIQSENAGTLILIALSITFLSYTLIKRPNKKTSIFGKILIFGGLLGLVTLLVEQGRDIANIEALIRTAATITGLYLERISPHKKLKKFMFLAIATKIEFIGITSLVSVITQSSAIINPVYWYSIIGLMAMSVPALALEKINIYRILVWTTTIVSLILLISILISHPKPTVAILSFLLVLWPSITARVLGRMEFF